MACRVKSKIGKRKKLVVDFKFSGEDRDNKDMCWDQTYTMQEY